METIVTIAGRQIGMDTALTHMNHTIVADLQRDLDLRFDGPKEAQVFADEYCARHEKVFGKPFTVDE